MFKKVICLTMVLVMVLVAPAFAFAAGVPVFQYNQAVSWGVTNVPVNYNTNYDYRYTVTYEGTDYIAGRYIYYSPSYVGTDFYITSITAYMGMGSNKSDTVKSITIEGFNGYSWISLWNDSTSGSTSFSRSISNYQVTPIKQIRVVDSVSYRNPDSASGTGSITISEVGISILGADQDSVNQARDAANTAATNATAAMNAANAASASAVNALNAVSNANGNTVTAVRDASGTVLFEARQAKTNAQNAYNTAQTVNTKIDALSTAVTNIQNNMGADTTPPEVIIRTVSGASATSGSQIGAVVNASDNVSATFGYSLDGTVYQPLPADGVINLPVNLSGNNLITVWVKDEAGNIGRDSITIRKL